MSVSAFIILQKMTVKYNFTYKEKTSGNKSETNKKFERFILLKCAVIFLKMLKNNAKILSQLANLQSQRKKNASYLWKYSLCTTLSITSNC